jgi:glycosyltransferase involved in cell wall biosynthesis
VVVVPLRIGSGTRLKVLEALAMAKPVVSTSVGCEGLDLSHGEHLLIADDPATFAASVLRLLEDPAEAASLGRRGRALVESRYGWEQSVAELERFHQSLFDRGPDLAQPAVGAANR